jgi:O-antigen/teichoic acid export membrane protein
VSAFRRNIVANFAGRIWASVLGLIFPPIYARLLGIESYGLIGVWASLGAILSILDLGLSATLNREMARHSADLGTESNREMRDLTRTMAVVFWTIGALAGAMIALVAPLISHHWVHAQRLSPELVTNSIRLMGVVFALQWPAGVYNGGLLGLQKQVTANVIQFIFLAVRLVGGALILWKVRASIQVFFVWQAAVMAGQTIVTAVALSKHLAGGLKGAAFRWRVLGANWRFSTGMFFISILAIVLMQADKMVVSKLLTLEQFGYYTLAWTVGGALGNLINPVFLAVFPRLTQLAKAANERELSRVYHASCQLISIIVLPAAATIAFFPREVLFAWSGDPRLVAMASGPLVLVAIGTACNGLMNVPYALMLAFGWTRLNVLANLVAIPIVVPLEYWLTKNYGTAGAAMGWVLINVSFVSIVIPVMHTRLLRGEQWRWYLVDVALPLGGLAAVVVPLRVLLHPHGGRLEDAAYLAAIVIAAMTAAAAAVPPLRLQALALFTGWRGLRRT